mgnify:CR=1 FL=1
MGYKTMIGKHEKENDVMLITLHVHQNKYFVEA